MCSCILLNNDQKPSAGFALHQFAGFYFAGNGRRQAHVTAAALIAVKCRKRRNTVFFNILVTLHKSRLDRFCLGSCGSSKRFQFIVFFLLFFVVHFLQLIKFAFRFRCPNPYVMLLPFPVPGILADRFLGSYVPAFVMFTVMSFIASVLIAVAYMKRR